jgi:hypothetical protein
LTGTVLICGFSPEAASAHARGETANIAASASENIAFIPL